MPLWLPTLIYIFATILIIDAAGSFIFWRYTQNRLFLKASWAWAANFINFMFHGAFQDHSEMTLFGHSFYFITSCYLASILCDTTGQTFKKKIYFVAAPVMIFMSLTVFEVTKSYMLASLILDFFIAYPMIYYSVKALKSKESPQLAKVLAILLILNGLHFLDYPFLHDSAIGSVYGFSFAFLVSILISILLPSLILQMISKKYTDELESVVLERTAKLKERTEDLEKTNQDNATLLSIVCHDISTPIMIANHSFSKLINNSDLLSLSEAKHVQKNLSAATDILRRVKDLHSSKLGKLEPQIQRLDIEPLIREAIHMFQPLCEHKEIHLNFVVKDLSQKIVMVDPVLFKNQVLGNLISNAIKFSEKGKQIEIQLSKFADEVIIDIIDFGRGIEDSKIPGLFDFHRSTSTPGTNSEIGSGLGLPTVKIITEKMGGRVIVKCNAICPLTKQGVQGTTFSLNFRLAS